MERTAGVELETARTPDEPLAVTNPVDVDNSAEGSETTRDKALIPLTVGSHALDAVLFKGDVERARAGLATGRGGKGGWCMEETAFPLLELTLAAVTTVGAAWGDAWLCP